MLVYASLLAAVRDLDPLLIDTLSGFTVGRARDCLLARFRFALFGAPLEGGSNSVEQIPDVELFLAGDLDLPAEISALEQSGLLGSLRAVQIPPGAKGNPAGAPLWVVRTHAGSQAEWIRWLQSIS